MTDAEKVALRNVAVFIAVKAIVYAGLLYAAKRLGRHISMDKCAYEDVVNYAQDDIKATEDLAWYVNPYTTKISDGTLGSLVRLDFD